MTSKRWPALHERHVRPSKNCPLCYPKKRTTRLTLPEKDVQALATFVERVELLTTYIRTLLGG